MSGIGIDFDRIQGFFKDVVVERGFEWNAGAPNYEMKKRGMSEQEMAKERLLIEIEVWKRLLVWLQDETDGEQRQYLFTKLVSY